MWQRLRMMLGTRDARADKTSVSGSEVSDRPLRDINNMADLEKLVEDVQGAMWRCDISQAEEMLASSSQFANHPLVLLSRAEISTCKLFLTGADEYLSEAESRCQTALQVATRQAEEARAHHAGKRVETQGATDPQKEDLETSSVSSHWGDDMPVHLSACFVVECSLTEAECLALGGGLQFYRGDYIAAAKALRASFLKYKKLLVLLDRVRGDVEPHADILQEESDEHVQGRAAEQLSQMINSKTAEIRAMNLNRRAVVPEIVLARTNELLRLKQLYRELTNIWISSDGHAEAVVGSANGRTSSLPPASRRNPGERKHEASDTLRVSSQDTSVSVSESVSASREAFPPRSSSSKGEIHRRNRSLPSVDGQRGRGLSSVRSRAMTNDVAQPTERRLKFGRRKTSGQSETSSLGDRSETSRRSSFRLLRSKPSNDSDESKQGSLLDVRDGDALIRAAYGDDPSEKASPEKIKRKRFSRSRKSGNQADWSGYASELVKVVTDLSRRVEFGMSIFNLVGSMARYTSQQQLQWALSLVGCPHDAPYALILLLKVHSHAGLRAPLASLLMIALPPEFLHSHLHHAAPDSGLAKKIALVETTIRTTIPESPFLYWLLACARNSENGVVTSRLELCKTAWGLCKELRPNAVMLGVTLCYISMAQGQWAKVVNYASQLSNAVIGSRQCRFSMIVLRAACECALETMTSPPTLDSISSESSNTPREAELLPHPIAFPTEELQPTNQPITEVTREPPPLRASLSKTLSSMFNIFSIYDLYSNSNQIPNPTPTPNPHPIYAAAPATSSTRIPNPVPQPPSRAWQLLLESQSVTSLESEELLSRRVKLYILKQRAHANVHPHVQSPTPIGFWLLAPEMVYLVRRGSPELDQVNHSLMLQLLDTGAKVMVRDFREWAVQARVTTQACMLGDLVEGLIEKGPGLLNSEVMKYPHLEFELYYEVSLSGTSLKLRFKHNSDEDDRQLANPDASARKSYATGVEISSIGQNNPTPRSNPNVDESVLGQFGDSLCLWLLLRGLALRETNCFREAAVMFRLVTSFHRTMVTFSLFLGPASLFHHAETVLAFPERDRDNVACALGLLTRARKLSSQLGPHEYDGYYRQQIDDLAKIAAK